MLNLETSKQKQKKPPPHTDRNRFKNILHFLLLESWSLFCCIGHHHEGKYCLSVVRWYHQSLFIPVGLIVSKHEMSPDCCVLCSFSKIKKKIFFSVQFLSLHWICYHTASVCFGFLAMRYVGSWLPDQGLNPHPPHWKGRPQPPVCQGCPSLSSFKVCLLFCTWLYSYHDVSPWEPLSTPTPPIFCI